MLGTMSCPHLNTTMFQSSYSTGAVITQNVSFGRKALMPTVHTGKTLSETEVTAITAMQTRARRGVDSRLTRRGKATVRKRSTVMATVIQEDRNLAEYRVQ